MTDVVAEIIDGLIADPTPYSRPQSEKCALLDRGLAALDRHHREDCPEYAHLWDSFDKSPSELLLPVQLFKTQSLRSIPHDQILKTLTSSGTTSQVVSKIYLDARTAQLQTKVLVKIMQHFLGRDRLPMLVIDCPSTVANRTTFSARGAGILGLSTFGRDRTFALNDDMTINHEALTQFMERYSGKPIFIFGFTFMVWEYFMRALPESISTAHLGEAILIHSGGWKKLIDRAVDNPTFKSTIADRLGVKKIHNFYGMVEQVGSIFVECEQGVLHAPSYADVKIVNVETMTEVPMGTRGVIAVESVLPWSYPGHRLLTEDEGTVLGEDTCSCGKMGRYFLVHGRLAKAEVRGCSDTHEAAGTPQ